MKRSVITFIATLLFLCLTSCVAYCASYLPLNFGWSMGIGGIILAVGVVFVALLHRKTWAKLTATAINALSMGFFLRGWYINRGFNNSIWLMLGVALLASAYFVLALLPTLHPYVNRHRSLYLILFTILSIVAFVLLVVLTKTTWISTLGYYGLLVLGFVFGACANGNDDDLSTTLLASSYTVAICAVIILVIALSGDGDGVGDIVSGAFDGGVDVGTDSTAKQSKKSQNPRNHF